MLGGGLGVDEVKLVSQGEGDEIGEGEFRRVRAMVKHGFAEESGPDREPVESPDQFAIAIGFEGMGDAEALEFHVGADHVVGDPGAVLTGARLRGAGANDSVEIRIDAELEAIGTQDAFQAFRAFEILGVENHSRVRREPKNGLPFGIPGEYSVFVGGDQSLGIQVASDRQQTIFVGARRVGEFESIRQNVMGCVWELFFERGKQGFVFE